MAQPTINDVQAVDPILTNMLIGYLQNASRFIAGRLFPSVNVDKDSGTYYILSKKYWFLDVLEQRAPGSPFADIGFGVETSTYTTLQWAAQEAIADEIRANSQLPLDLESVAVQHLANLSSIRKERALSADFFVTGVWGTDDTSATDWDDFASGDPFNDIMTAKRTISDNTGMDGNTLAVGYVVHQALTLHPDIIDRLKYTQVAGMSAVEAGIGSLLDVNYLVSKASYNSANEAATFVGAAIIDDDALVCHVNAGAGVMGATAGKTFVWQPGGGNGSIYRDRDTNHRDLIQFKEQWDQNAVATDLGYFFSGIV